jgi:hypothetical protein
MVCLFAAAVGLAQRWHGLQTLVPLARRASTFRGVQAYAPRQSVSVFVPRVVIVGAPARRDRVGVPQRDDAQEGNWPRHRLVQMDARFRERVEGAIARGEERRQSDEAACRDRRRADASCR